MANLPRSFNVNSPAAYSGAYSSNDPTLYSAEKLILDLLNPDLRENALHVLSKKREIFHDLAPMLWHSPCTSAILLQEIVVAYRATTTPTMTAAESNRICCLAHHLFCN